MAVLFLLFLVVPAAELYLIIQSSRSFGFANTLGALVVISLFGAWLARREGTKVWTRFNQAISSGQVPSKEIADGVCVLGAGALLMTPGFLTDVFGILLLIPPSRAIFRSMLLKRFSGRVKPVRATYRGGVHETRGGVYETRGGVYETRGGVYETTAEQSPPLPGDPAGPGRDELAP